MAQYTKHRMARGQVTTLREPIPKTGFRLRDSTGGLSGLMGMAQSESSIMEQAQVPQEQVPS